MLALSNCAIVVNVFPIANTEILTPFSTVGLDISLGTGPYTFVNTSGVEVSGDIYATVPDALLLYPLSIGTLSGYVQDALGQRSPELSIPVGY